MKRSPGAQAGQKVLALTKHSQQHILYHCRELGADEVSATSHEVEKRVGFCKAHAASLGGMAQRVQ